MNRSKTQDKQPEDKCGGIKDLLEQKKKELEEMAKNWPEEKLKEIGQEKILGEIKKNETAKKIIETTEQAKEKYDKLKETVEVFQKKYDLCRIEFPLSSQAQYRGTIVENSLKDKSILKDLKIDRIYQDEDWLINDVIVSEDQINKLGQYLEDGPWYMNFWKPDADEMVVVFKDKNYKMRQSDKSTWADALEHGKSIGIPEEQLDFYTKE